MKACREFTREKGWITTKAYRIPSQSEKGKFHIVQLFNDGHFECDCIAGSFKKDCFHKRTVRESLFRPKPIKKY